VLNWKLEGIVSVQEVFNVNDHSIEIFMIDLALHSLRWASFTTDHPLNYEVLDGLMQ
jgi:hypothetical protein